ncbi:hypothetical protein D3C86_1776060 [compost metagenome]
MQGQADDDRQGAGGGQYALDRQIEHISQGGDDRDKENHSTQQVLQQSPGMSHPLHQSRTDQHGQGARSEQPPADLQPRGRQMQRHVVDPGCGFQRVHAFVEQHQAVQGENHRPNQKLHVVATGTDQAPQQQIDQDQGESANQRVFGEQ